MRKMRIVHYISLLMLFCCTAAEAQVWLDPTVTEKGKDLPRTPLISYASRDEALQGRFERSKYLQPLPSGEEWQVTEDNLTRTYSTTFTMPFVWIDREVFLHIESAGASYSFEINGTEAGYSQDGHTASEFDITQFVKEDLNTLAVTVHKDQAAAAIENNIQQLLPLTAYIVSQPRVRVRDIIVETQADHGNGLFAAGVVLKSHLLNPKSYRVYYELIAPSGDIVSYGHRDLTLDMWREDTVRFLANIPNVLAWSHKAPYLYTLMIKTQYEGRFGEYIAVPVGFRSLEVNDGVLSVNAQPVELHATDFAADGDVSSTADRLQAIKDQGFNTIRVTGAPQPDMFYELCDRLGLYVVDQAAINTGKQSDSRRRGGNPSNDPKWDDAYVSRAVGMYHASKLHPSTVAFTLATDASNGYCLYESYLALKRIEHVRPILYASAAGEWNTDTLTMNPSPAAGTDSPQVSIARTDDGKFIIRNADPLAPVEVAAVYTVRAGRSKVAEGEKPFIIPAGASAELTVPLESVKAGKSYTIELRLEKCEPTYVYTHHVADRGPQPKQTKAGKIITSVREFFRSKPKPETPLRTTIAEETFTGQKPQGTNR